MREERRETYNTTRHTHTHAHTHARAQRCLVVGGGYIGTEVAAALTEHEQAGVEHVAICYMEDNIMARILPPAVSKLYVLCYTILYYTILYYTILYSNLLYYTILYYTILYYTILYYTIL